MNKKQKDDDADAAIDDSDQKGQKGPQQDFFWDMVPSASRPGGPGSICLVQLEDDEENEEDKEDDTEVRPASENRKSAARRPKKEKAPKAKKKEAPRRPMALLVVALSLLAVLCFGLLVVLPAQNAGVATGRWQYQVLVPDNGSSLGGEIIMAQQGEKLSGQGYDDLAGTPDRFKVSGSIDGAGRHLKFKKLIARTGGFYDYEGDLQNGTIAGVWRQSYRLGSRVITKRSGTWKAVRAAGPVEQKGFNLVEAIRTASSDPNTPDRLRLALIAFIGLGALVYFGSTKMFGHSGYLSKRSKSRYVPSQYRSQHAQMMRRMAGVAKPDGLPLGERNDKPFWRFWGGETLSLPPDMRRENPHFVLVGQRGRGKSRLLANMIAHDIAAAKKAVVVIDSDGGLTELLWSWAASHPNGQEICSRITIIDPTRRDCLHTYNPLAWPQDDDLQSCAATVVAGVRALYQDVPGQQSQWNYQNANLLRSCAMLLTMTDRTLADLPVLLGDNDFRDLLLEQVQTQAKTRNRPELVTLLENWNGYKKTARSEQWIPWTEPILNRIQPILSDPVLRNILCGRSGRSGECSLDLRQVLEERRVLLVRLPQARLQQNGSLVGSLLIGGLKQAALSFWTGSAGEPRPCSLFVDDFTNFMEKELFDAITSETNKLHIGLHGVTKTLQSLTEEFRNLIVANTGTLGVFAVSKKDADNLGPQIFRVDGRREKVVTVKQAIDRVNSTPTYELIQDEEKLNIDRLVAQDNRCYFAYRVGSIAGVFQVKAPTFDDVPAAEVNQDLVEEMMSPGRTED